VENLEHQGFRALEGIKGRKLRRQSMIELSFKKFFQFKSEVKLGFGGKI
jgi:hypothetical protein